ncbi:MAG: substrate-binding domain-containing protein [Abditibacteriaceae bacterium]
MIDKLLKVLLVSVLMFGLTGCYGVSERKAAPPPAPAVKHTIAVLPYGGKDAFWQQFHEGANEAAADAGYHVQWELPPPVWTPRTQAEMLKNVLNLNPPGIVLGPLHRNLMQASLVDTVQMDIPVVIAVSNEDTSYKITYVGSDNAALGTDLAKWVGKLTPPNSVVAVINIQEGMRSVDTRQHSVLETLSQSFPMLQISQVPFPAQDVLNYEESNLQKIIKNSLREFLKSQPTVKAVVALDENSTLAAWQILKGIPENQRPLLFGVSVNLDLIAACRNGKIAALAVQDARKMGAESTKAIIEFKGGTRPPKEVLIPYKMIHAGG